MGLNYGHRWLTSPSITVFLSQELGSSFAGTSAQRRSRGDSHDVSQGTASWRLKRDWGICFRGGSPTSWCWWLVGGLRVLPWKLFTRLLQCPHNMASPRGSNPRRQSRDHSPLSWPRKSHAITHTALCGHTVGQHKGINTTSENLWGPPGDRLTYSDVLRSSRKLRSVEHLTSLLWMQKVSVVKR